MRRIATTDDSQAVSLFPFLAVLLSTMGALLLVLVVMARQARLHAAQGEQDQAASARVANLDETAEAFPGAGRLEEAAKRLQAIREAGLGELEESRLRLRHADEHLRQLQDEVARLYRQAQSLEEMNTHRLEDREQATREFDRLRGLIRDTEAQIEEQRRRAATAPKSYAIVPYQGPHGTRRRPLYIECRRDAVVLQPEGVELAVSDFQGPLGPGNPLASALRAAEEYYVAGSSEGASETPEEKPYPLVLVRPDGIAAYYHVRRALEGWGSDFGYELLDGDWQLAFPLPNPQVANVQQRAIDLARARQQALALAAPRRFGGSGGLGGADDTSEGGLFGGLDPALPNAQSGQSGGGGWGNGHEKGAPATSRYASVSSSPGMTAEAASLDPSRAETGRGRSVPVSEGDGRFPTGGMSSTGVQPSGAGMEGAESRGLEYQQTQGELAASTEGSRQAPHIASGGAEHGNPARRHPASSRGGSMAGGSPGGTSAEPSGAGPQAPGGMRAGGQDGDSLGTSSSVASLAEVRGADWAMREVRLGAVPVRRTIQVVVRNDRLAVLPEQGAAEASGRMVPVTHSIQAAVDPFVQAVQERIQKWGTAGRGLYWQPIIVFKPGPDGVHHAEAMRRLLAGSGLEVAP